MARFEREATVLASLNHPNIGAIYRFEEDDSRLVQRRSHTPLRRRQCEDGVGPLGLADDRK
jgi:serine/threonine protein kinase